jgi:hypothetical protein
VPPRRQRARRPRYPNYSIEDHDHPAWSTHTVPRAGRPTGSPWGARAYPRISRKSAITPGGGQALRPSPARGTPAMGGPRQARAPTPDARATSGRQLATLARASLIRVRRGVSCPRYSRRSDGLREWHEREPRPPGRLHCPRSERPLHRSRSSGQRFQVGELPRLADHASERRLRVAGRRLAAVLVAAEDEQVDLVHDDL